MTPGIRAKGTSTAQRVTSGAVDPSDSAQRRHDHAARAIGSPSWRERPRSVRDRRSSPFTAHSPAWRPWTRVGDRHEAPLPGTTPSMTSSCGGCHEVRRPASVPIRRPVTRTVATYGSTLVTGVEPVADHERLWFDGLGGLSRLARGGVGRADRHHAAARGFRPRSPSRSTRRGSRRGVSRRGRGLPSGCPVVHVSPRWSVASSLAPPVGSPVPRRSSDGMLVAGGPRSPVTRPVRSAVRDAG